jgi:hypothetical protein
MNPGKAASTARLPIGIIKMENTRRGIDVPQRRKNAPARRWACAGWN